MTAVASPRVTGVTGSMRELSRAANAVTSGGGLMSGWGGGESLGWEMGTKHSRFRWLRAAAPRPPPIPLPHRVRVASTPFFHGCLIARLFPSGDPRAPEAAGSEAVLPSLAPPLPLLLRSRRTEQRRERAMSDGVEGAAAGAGGGEAAAVPAAAATAGARRDRSRSRSRSRSRNRSRGHGRSRQGRSRSRDRRRRRSSSRSRSRSRSRDRRRRSRSRERLSLIHI